MSVDRAGVIHVCDKGIEHPVGLFGFALQVRQHPRAALGRDDIHLDGLRLPESQHPTHRLIPRLVAMAREVRHSVGVLPIQAE